MGAEAYVRQLDAILADRAQAVTGRTGSRESAPARESSRT
jgi:hypothetical protein